eukprot:TRINITY_DN5246_c0_g1_i5.p1 TRINITY_DN5246_c0_g1~~TRINITY_DN5246_c0_g1_i5.p1  ORF type:complete len:345 (+),score=100.44 TRINITY_DN5246_c0_g1_i5:69-1037(+)
MCIRDRCKNPQYFLNLTKATHLKIILRKVVNKRNKGVRVGLNICRYTEVPTTKSKTQNTTAKVKRTTVKTVAMSPTKKLMSQTDAQLKAPIMEHIERKLQIKPTEPCIESSYANEETAALYFFWNPIEGPFIIVPCLYEEDVNAKYTLTIFSNNPVELEKLDESKNAVLIGKWDDISDGGCHLFDEQFESDSSLRTWTQNPKFHLQFKEEGRAHLRIHLAIAEKNWKAKVATKTKNPIGGMIGIYVLEKREGKIHISSKRTEETFVPLMELIEEHTFNDVSKNGYIIMPSTYERKIQGVFIISVSSDREFTFVPLKQSDKYQ